MKLPFAGRLLAVAVLAAASAALPVSSAFAETTEKPKVALVMKSLANEFFLTMEDGAKAYQKEHASEFDLISNGIKDETDTADREDSVRSASGHKNSPRARPAGRAPLRRQKVTVCPALW